MEKEGEELSLGVGIGGESSRSHGGVGRSYRSSTNRSYQSMSSIREIDLMSFETTEDLRCIVRLLFSLINDQIFSAKTQLDVARSDLIEETNSSNLRFNPPSPPNPSPPKSRGSSSLDRTTSLLRTTKFSHLTLNPTSGSASYPPSSLFHTVTMSPPPSLAPLASSECYDAFCF